MADNKLNKEEDIFVFILHVRNLSKWLENM